MHVSGRCPWLVLAAWPLAASPPASAEPPPVALARLRAVEIDFASLAPLTRTVMRHELGVVLAPAALALSWRRASPAGETDRDELRVVLLRSTGLGTDQGALGSTARQGQVAPTIWVYVPAVALTLGLDPEAVATSLEAQRLVGLALGRVVAHEVVHAAGSGRRARRRERDAPAVARVSPHQRPAGARERLRRGAGRGGARVAGQRWSAAVAARDLRAPPASPSADRSLADR